MVYWIEQGLNLHTRPVEYEGGWYWQASQL